MQCFRLLNRLRLQCETTVTRRGSTYERLVLTFYSNNIRHSTKAVFDMVLGLNYPRKIEEMFHSFYTKNECIASFVYLIGLFARFMASSNEAMQKAQNWCIRYGLWKHVRGSRMPTTAGKSTKCYYATQSKCTSAVISSTRISSCRGTCALNVSFWTIEK